jgi:hypothetical protein
MNYEIANTWVNALRSGEYKQQTGGLGFEKLSTGELKFCCLGVLCDLYVKEHPEAEAELGIRTRVSTTGESIHILEYFGDSCFLPHTISTWAEIPRAFEEELAMKNDAGATFDELATIIEQNQRK